MVAVGQKKSSSLKITLIRSTIGCLPKQVGTVCALGLRRMHQTVEHEANDTIRGMIRTVAHLLKVEMQ